MTDGQQTRNRTHGTIVEEQTTMHRRNYLPSLPNARHVGCRCCARAHQSHPLLTLPAVLPLCTPGPTTGVKEPTPGPPPLRFARAEQVGERECEARSDNDENRLKPLDHLLDLGMKAASKEGVLQKVKTSPHKRHSYGITNRRSAADSTAPPVLPN